MRGIFWPTLEPTSFFILYALITPPPMFLLSVWRFFFFFLKGRINRKSTGEVREKRGKKGNGDFGCYTSHSLTRLLGKAGKLVRALVSNIESSWSGNSPSLTLFHSISLRLDSLCMFIRRRRRVWRSSYFGTF